jgi:hypothetical protein
VRKPVLTKLIEIIVVPPEDFQYEIEGKNAEPPNTQVRQRPESLWWT